MLLTAHILIAVTSLGVAGYAWRRPSRLALVTGSTLVALTLATGTLLVMYAPARLPQACLTGLLYLGLVGAGLVAGTRKLRQAG